MQSQVLIVEDDPLQRRGLERLLGQRAFDVLVAGTGEAAIRAVVGQHVVVAVVDLHLPDMSGFEVIRRLKELVPNIECVVLTGQGSSQVADESRLAGASDYFEKPIIDHPRFFQVIRRACEVQHLKKRIDALEPLAETQGLVGRSAGIERVRELVDRMAGATASVLITGESGVGKEVVAEALHATERRRGEFVRINCAALPEALIEAELFGVEEGTYTGQKGRRDGLFTLAAKGTVFLDEIGEMPIGLQPKLLRVLQSQRYRPVGSRTERELTARVVAATNVDLLKAIRQGLFREDLYFRLAVLTIHVPPLRERRDDIRLLALYFVAKYASAEGRPGIRLSDDALDALDAYPWPGNVRELSNTIQRAVILSRQGRIEAPDLELGRAELRPVLTSSPPVAEDVDPWESWMALPFTEAKAAVTEAFTRRYLERKLAETHGNVSRAAAVAGMLRPNFKREMRKFGVSAEAEDSED